MNGVWCYCFRAVCLWGREHCSSSEPQCPASPQGSGSQCLAPWLAQGPGCHSSADLPPSGSHHTWTHPEGCLPSGLLCSLRTPQVFPVLRGSVTGCREPAVCLSSTAGSLWRAKGGPDSPSLKSPRRPCRRTVAGGCILGPAGQTVGRWRGVVSASACRTVLTNPGGLGAQAQRCVASLCWGLGVCNQGLGGFYLRPLSWACRWKLSPCVLTRPFRCLPLLSVLQDTRPVGLGAHPEDLNLHSLLEDPLSAYATWGVGFSA